MSACWTWRDVVSLHESQEVDVEERCFLPIRIQSYRLYTEIATCVYDSACNLASVRNKNRAY